MRYLFCIVAGLCTWLSSVSGEVPISFWHSMTGAKGKLLSDIVSRFNQDQKGKVAVSLQFVGSYEEGLNKLRTALLAHRGPNLIQIVEIGTRLMAESGAIRPLHELADGDPTFPLAQFLPGIRRYYEIGGKLFSLPFATSNPILYYNRSRLESVGIKPPRTFDELEVAARKLTDPSRRQFGITWPLHSWFFEQFMARQGQTLVDADNGRGGLPTKANFDTEAGVRVTRLWHKLVKEN